MSLWEWKGREEASCSGPEQGDPEPNWDKEGVHLEW